MRSWWKPELLRIEHTFGNTLHDPCQGAAGLNGVEAHGIHVVVEHLRRPLIEHAHLWAEGVIWFVILLVFTIQFFASDCAGFAAVLKLLFLDGFLVELL